MQAAENGTPNGGSGTPAAVPGPEGAQATQAANQAQINLALNAGSDATGASATALQAASAAAATPPAPAPALPGAAVPAITGSGSISATVSAVPAVGTAAAAADSSGLAGDGSAHARSGDGGAGGGLGGGGLAGGGDGAAALQQLSTATASTADSTPAATLRVHAPVDSAEFPQGVADRVSFAVGNDWNSAKLQVNPPQLGPIDLQIAVQGAHAQVMMSTHSAVTREALETSIPKLKEMLGSQGFTQVSVDISQRSFQERSAFNQPYTSTRQPSGTSASSGPVGAVGSGAAASPASRAALGVVDAYV